MKTLKVVANIASNMAITGTSALVGYGTASYCANHDVCNDPETSTIVGVGTGVAVFVGMNSGLNAIKSAVNLQVSRRALARRVDAAKVFGGKKKKKNK